MNFYIGAVIYIAGVYILHLLRKELQQRYPEKKRLLAGIYYGLAFGAWIVLVVLKW